MKKNLQKPAVVDYGTSAQAGLRRLDKAAQAGNDKAADMLRRVLDPDDPTTVNSALVIMGWRKPMISVVNTNERLTGAAVRTGLARNRADASPRELLDNRRFDSACAALQPNNRSEAHRV